MNPNLIEATGLSLLHFFWQGGVLTAIAWALLHALRKKSAQSRYMVCCVILAAMATAPVVTGITIYEGNDPIQQSSNPALQQSSNPTILRSRDPAILQSADSAIKRSSNAAPNHKQQTTLTTYICLGWLVGAALLTLRCLGGFLVLARLRTQGRTEAPEWLQARFKAIANQLGIHKIPKLSISTQVTVPTVIGAFKSLVLVPAGALANMSPEMLEALLAHELAHVRRWDFIVNVFQSLVEIALFYHPAVWWLSNRIRQERENCCDDLVVATFQDKRTYVHALSRVEELRIASLALRADGGDLLIRIKRILGETQMKTISSPAATALILGAVLLFPAIKTYAAAQIDPETGIPAQAQDARKRAVEAARMEAEIAEKQAKEAQQRAVEARKKAQKAREKALSIQRELLDKDRMRASEAKAKQETLRKALDEKRRAGKKVSAEEIKALRELAGRLEEVSAQAEKRAYEISLRKLELDKEIRGESAAAEQELRKAQQDLEKKKAALEELKLDRVQGNIRSFSEDAYSARIEEIKKQQKLSKEQLEELQKALDRNHESLLRELQNSSADKDLLRELMERMNKIKAEQDALLKRLHQQGLTKGQFDELRNSMQYRLQDKTGKGLLDKFYKGNADQFKTQDKRFQELWKSQGKMDMFKSGDKLSHEQLQELMKHKGNADQFKVQGKVYQELLKSQGKADMFKGSDKLSKEQLQELTKFKANADLFKGYQGKLSREQYKELLKSKANPDQASLLERLSKEQMETLKKFQANPDSFSKNESFIKDFYKLSNREGVLRKFYSPDRIRGRSIEDLKTLLEQEKKDLVTLRSTPTGDMSEDQLEGHRAKIKAKEARIKEIQNALAASSPKGK